MSMKYAASTAVIILAVLALAVGGSSAEAGPPHRTYRVTLSNLTDGQPFSPGAAATHRPSFHAFEVGELAHPAIEAIAEDGNHMPAIQALTDLAEDGVVSDWYEIGRPITRAGTVVGDFTDSITFEIDARPGDRLSLATMLICTNDGFTGLDGVKLPAQGSVTYHSMGYDAGTEENTEESEHIVDPCSGLGPVPLAGDPNDPNGGVASDPLEPISHHPGISGDGDLSASMHDWMNPVAEIEIERID
ncbi:MAG TPA: spondin domain-containing protein [Dehalococcoidia bacterium]|nr:spondin domain-containing protein [Dehalococcoidia bacterium]